MRTVEIQEQILVFEILNSLKGIYMLQISAIETQIFVTYTIKPLPSAFKKSLDRYLLENVCSFRGEVEECIYVGVDDSNSISTIRYQFGEGFNEYEAEEVGELIEQQIEHWLVRNNAHGLIED